MAYRCPWCVLWRALAGVSALGAGLAVCGAQADPPEERKPPRLEVWAGAEAFQDIWSVHSGATWAPFGSVQEDGLRVRAVLGQGYDRGSTIAFGDALVGYHRQLGPVTLKLFGGIAVAERYPPQEVRSGIDGKGVLEAWWNVTDRVWTSADVALTAPQMGVADRVDYAGRLRLGWRLDPQLSAGLEAGAGGFLTPVAVEHGRVRGGGFLRYEWSGGEVSVSGGVFGGGSAGEREGPAQTFATVSVLTRF